MKAPWRLTKLREQDFQNLLVAKDYKRLIKLALAMNQPGRIKSLLNTVFESRKGSQTDQTSDDLNSITGSAAVDKALAHLGPSDLKRLLRFIRDWNTSVRTSAIAQRTLHLLLKSYSPESLAAMHDTQNLDEESATAPGEGDDFVPNAVIESDPKKRLRARKEEKTTLRELVDAIIPYTERHYTRADKLVKESFICDYFLNEMDAVFGSELLTSSM